VVCSLHQPSLALEHADRVVALRSGRVVLDAPSSALDAAALAAVYR
jgi:phosphonate transport system ATP-binding protein